MNEQLTPEEAAALQRRVLRLKEAALIGLEYAEEVLAENRKNFEGRPDKYAHDEEMVEAIRNAIFHDETHHHPHDE